MKHEKLSEALGHISDRHIAEAVTPKRRFPWAAAVAAVLALAILLSALLHPQPQENITLQTPTLSPTVPTVLPTEPVIPADSIMPIQPNPSVTPLGSKYAIATPKYPVLCAYPLENEFDGDAHTKWWEDQRALHNQPEGYVDNLQSCWNVLLPALLKSNNGENITCSPVNIYMALAMLAECTSNESRQQLLTLLNADSLEALRLQANQVWRAHYNDDGLCRSVLGSSLWLEENYGFEESTVKLLADNYYASVFQGDLGSEEMNKTLCAWLNQQTGGILQEQVQNAKLDPTTVLAIATTIYYQAQWQEEFSKDANTTDVFHGAKSDTTETFMHTILSYGPYYWGDHFSAVSLNLEGDSRMWLFLPDEGVSPEQITEEVTAFLMQKPYLAASQYKNQKNVKVNLSMPKFDVSSDLELSKLLQNLGITDIFDQSKADFSSILAKADGGYVDQVKHAARVTVDEQGVTAAAFTLILRCGGAMPPQEEIDFTLDRPFMFVVESQDDLPLFAGIVNQA